MCRSRRTAPPPFVFARVAPVASRTESVGAHGVTFRQARGTAGLFYDGFLRVACYTPRAPARANRAAGCRHYGRALRQARGTAEFARLRKFHACVYRCSDLGAYVTCYSSEHLRFSSVFEGAARLGYLHTWSTVFGPVPGNGQLGRRVFSRLLRSL
jgi:hypothetical protein